MITDYEKPFAAVRWNEELKIVELEWKGFASSEEFRLAMNKALSLTKEKKAARILTDSRQLKVILPEDQVWINDTWTPNMTASGVKKLASLVPESAVAKITVDRMVRKSESEGTQAIGYEFSFFQTPEQARKWLAN